MTYYKLILFFALFFILLTISFLPGLQIGIFFAYCLFFYICEKVNSSVKKKYIFLLLFVFSYLHFLVLFWWLRHISLYAPIFLAFALAIIKTIAFFIPFLLSQKLRASKLLVFIVAAVCLEYKIVDIIYPQPYLQANYIFIFQPSLFKPILLLRVLYQNIYLIILSYFLYSLIKISLLKCWVSTLEKINLIFNVVIILLLLVRLINPPTISQNTGKTLNIAVIQPNIPQDIKNLYRYRAEEIFFKMFSQLILAKKKSKEKLDLIIAPETIFPYIVSYKNNGYYLLRNLRKRIESDILLGGFWEDKEGKVYNSAFLITKTKIQVYKKVKLVLFGEFLPLGNVKFVKKIYDLLLPTKDFETLYPAKKYKVFKYKNIAIQPLICFEGFLEESYANKEQTDLYINLSNEGWYKDGLELSWAWDITKAFSIYSSTPIIRATNTGISGFHIENKSIILSKNNQTIDVDDVLVHKVSIQKFYNTTYETILSKIIVGYCYLILGYIFLFITTLLFTSIFIGYYLLKAKKINKSNL
jgi:apolipoprotein N-acyltransferase